VKFNQKTILVIDDEDAIRQSFMDYLEDLDFKVIPAQNGRIGLEIFEKEKIDLITVDLRMPEIDGLEVLTKVNETSPDTPIIVVSGTGVISDAVEALHKGAWDYLLKPIEDFSMLQHAVNNALEKAKLKRENLEYQKHLENLVNARTKELIQANSSLTHINDRLRRIVESTRTLSFCTKVKKFGSRLLNEFGQHMSATGGSLYLKEKNGFKLVHALDPGHAPDFIAIPINDKSVFHQVITEKKTILIEDINTLPELSKSGWNMYKDGSALIFPLSDENGEITGIITLHSKTAPPFIAQDKEIGTILASYSCEALRAVRATESLRENEKQLGAILDNMKTGIIIVELTTKKVVYVNPTASELIGARVDDIVGGVCHDVLCPAEEGQCPVIDLHDVVDSSERILKSKDGKLIPILKSITKTMYDGKECLLESFIDLTSQKQAAKEKQSLEGQLRQAQKLESLGTLAGGIAHDFNNILSAINGYTELALMELKNTIPSLSEKLKSVLHAGNRAKELVAQILTFSRMQEQILAPVRIAPILKEALKLLQASLPANIELKTNIFAQEKVMADPTQIHQIIMNLCTNAYHAMERIGGTLTVSLEVISDQEFGSIADFEPTSEKYMKLTIQDTGTGIKPSDIDRIFEPYFSTKEKNKGTGLGLAVVHGIVKNHEGHISVKSKVNEGTTFYVLLPTTEYSSDSERTLQNILPRGSETILFVDDEKDIVDICHQMLDKLGYNVTGIVGSLDALNNFQQKPDYYNLVITDLNMPHMTGDILSKEIMNIRPDIPIILCTGFSDNYNENRANRMGIRKLLMKPIAMNIMAETIREVLDKTDEPVID